jgi:hypothetical protein
LREETGKVENDISTHIFNNYSDLLVLIGNKEAE